MLKTIASYLRNNFLIIFSSIISTIGSIFFVYRGSMNKPPHWLTLDWIYALFVLSIIIFIFNWIKKPLKFLILSRNILLVFLPAEIILMAGFQTFNRLSFFPFSLLLQLATNFYLALFVICIFFKLQKYEKFSDFKNDLKKDSAKTREKKKWATGMLLALIMILNLSFGAYHLAEFAAVDEPLWTFGRIPKFWNNVKEREFYKTMVSDKPGITVAIISGIGLNWTDPLRYKFDEDKIQTVENISGIEKMNFAMRLPILLFNVVLLIPLYLFIRKLSDKTTAAFSLILIGLSPILLGMSTIINPDALLWSLSSLCFLGFLIYLNNQEKKYLYYSGFFLGLSILTKYIANIFYVFFFGLIFLEFAFNQEKYKNVKISDYLKRAFTDYFSLVLVSLLTFFLFLPAAWVNAARVLESTILSKAFIKFWPAFLLLLAIVALDLRFSKGKALTAFMEKMAEFRKWILEFILVIFIVSIAATILNTYSGMKPYDFESILASPKSSYLNGNFFSLYLANFYSLIFGLIPLALLALIFRPARFFFNKKTTSYSSIYIILFIIVYYLASTIENVSATVHYQIIVYPLALIVAAEGLAEFIKIIPAKKYSIYISYVILIGASLYSLNFIRPFYMSYASDLLPRQYVLNLKDMGDGSFEAAEYLNNRPDAKNLVVWTDKRGVCYFFAGTCETGFDFDKEGTVFDYYVVTSGRESRTIKMTLARVGGGNTTLFRLDKLYDIENPEYKLEIGGRPNSFVKIINAKDIK